MTKSTHCVDCKIALTQDEAHYYDCRCEKCERILWGRMNGDDQCMTWEKAESAKIEFSAYYLVKDNGGEWRDFDLKVMSGQMINHKLAPNYIRGRPEWVAKITRPTDVGLPTATDVRGILR